MNIFICGVPRSGKTTLAKRLKSELSNYNLIVSESIRNGFQKMDVDNYKEWGNKNSLKRKKDFPEFLFEFLKWNNYFSECNNIVDLALVDLETVIKMKEDNDIVVCLGFGCIESEEIFSFIRSRENEGDYTKKYSDEELDKIWKNIAFNDKENFRVCDENGIMYFDVLKENKMLEFIVSKIDAS